MGKLLTGIFLIFFVGYSFGQNQEVKITLPLGDDWNVKTEGDIFEFRVSINTDSTKLDMIAPKGMDMSLDSTGVFRWHTQPDMISDEDDELYYYLLFVAERGLDRDSAYVELTVKNRPRIQTAPEIIPEPEKIEIPVLEEIILPKVNSFSLLHEGDTVVFQLEARMSSGPAENITYRLEEGEPSGARLDPYGKFMWVVPYTYVSRLQQTAEKHIFIIAEDENGNTVSKKVVFSIFHKNQAPTVETLPKFYVLLGTNNTYTISSDNVKDPDGDPIVFIVNPANLPQGMNFNSQGKIQWEPSRSQFSLLRNEPIIVPFFVEDQPSKDRTEGRLLVEASYMDMPPEITVVPNESSFTINENEQLHLAFHISDPNGDDDLSKFDFIADDPRITKDLLIKNTDNQYEFVWTPTYSFVEDPDQKIEFDIRFFAVDETNQSTEKRITITVNETEDLSKVDAKNYELYKNTLTEALDLMDQLEENQSTLEKELKKANRGKKNRAIVNVSLGAITGLSPVITKQADSQRAISVIGGTSTATLGTLEVKDILGKSASAINAQIKTNNELYNQFLSEGSSFARRYNSKKERRNSNYSFDLEKFKIILNSPKLATLELDANWDNKKKLNNRRLKSIFSDFDAVD